MIKKFLLIIPVFCALVCAACFSPWKGDEGIISIRIGGENAVSRQAAWLDDFDIERLRHTITLEGPVPVEPRENIRYGDSVNFSVTPGTWTITIEAWEVRHDGAEEYLTLIAKGSKTVDIKPGPNGVINIPMVPEEEVKPPPEEIIDAVITIDFNAIEDGEKPVIVKFPELENEDFKVIIILKDAVENPTQYSGIEWRIKGITGSGPSFILDLYNESYYDEDGKYYLTVELWKNGIPYSQSIIIEVIYDEEENIEVKEGEE